MTQKQRTAVIALFRITSKLDEIDIKNKEIQNDFLSVLEGIFDHEDLPQTSQ